jgi:hypothetical protein
MVAAVQRMAVVTPLLQVGLGRCTAAARLCAEGLVVAKAAEPWL